MNTEQLEQWCIGKDVDEVTEFLKNKFNAKYVDEKIDDGGDEEGTYVMKKVLSIGNGYADLYYLDTDRIISYAEIDADNLMESKKKQTVKLNESKLRKIVAESVRKVLKEGFYDGVFDKYKNQSQIRSVLKNVQGELESINRFGTSIPEEDLRNQVREAQIAIERALKMVNGDALFSVPIGSQEW